MIVTRNDTDALIAGLVGELSPKAPLRLRHGAAVFAGAALLAMLTAALGLGVRGDVAAGDLTPVFLVANGLFLILAIAAAASAISMARPQVGSRRGGWIWAAATTAVLPTSAVLMQVFDPSSLKQSSPDGVTCLLASVSLGLFAILGLTLWLRRGAPTSPRRVGMIAGIAGGAVGAFSFAFHCPCDDLFHVGIWHASAAVAGGLIGWIAVPRFLRW